MVDRVGAVVFDRVGAVVYILSEVQLLNKFPSSRTHSHVFRQILSSLIIKKPCYKLFL